jgi:hypothetical protein
MLHFELNKPFPCLNIPYMDQKAEKTIGQLSNDTRWQIFQVIHPIEVYRDSIKNEVSIYS